MLPTLIHLVLIEQDKCGIQLDEGEVEVNSEWVLGDNFEIAKLNYYCIYWQRNMELIQRFSRKSVFS